MSLRRQWPTIHSDPRYNLSMKPGEHRFLVYSRIIEYFYISFSLLKLQSGFDAWLYVNVPILYYKFDLQTPRFAYT